MMIPEREPDLHPQPRELLEGSFNSVTGPPPLATPELPPIDISGGGVHSGATAARASGFGRVMMMLCHCLLGVGL